MRGFMRLAAAAALLLASVAVANAQSGPGPTVRLYCPVAGSSPTIWLPCSSINPLSITAPNALPVIGSIPKSPMQSQLPVTTGAIVALTVPNGSTYATISLRQAAAGCINYTTDGTTTPQTGATGTGRQLCPGQQVPYPGSGYLTNFKAIAATANTAIDVEYGQ